MFWLYGLNYPSVRFMLSLFDLQVNGIDLRTASHDEAINVLRQTPQRVRLTVFRDEAQYKEEELWDMLSVELQKKPGQGLGLSIVGRRYWSDLEWSDIVIYIMPSTPNTSRTFMLLCIYSILLSFVVLQCCSLM